MAIVVASATFLLMLVTGLGFVQQSVWSWGVPLAAGLTGLGLLIGLLRPVDEAAVVARLDADHGLKNALSTTRELLQGPTQAPAQGAAQGAAQRAAQAAAPALSTMARAHIQHSLSAAERLGLARTVTADLGGHARILGVLCLCIVSVAMI